ncbi:MAG: TonB-dependent siderophore receptor, partial [Opitutaceae bacterium]
MQQSAPPQESNQVSMRGYTLDNAQRDGVTDYLVAGHGGFDYSLIERIEVVKGPSGILYGAHSPGGIVNLISKRPLSEPRTEINVMAGSDEMYRAELDTSNFFDQDRRFGYRLAAARADTEGVASDRPQEGNGLLAINPSVSFRSDNGWNVWAWAAIMRDHMRRSTYGTPALPTDPDFSYPGDPSTTGAPLYEVAGNHMLRNLQYIDSETYELGVSKSFELGPVTVDMRLLGRDYHQEGIDLGRIRAIDAFDILVGHDGHIIGTDFRAVPLSAAEGRVAQIGRSAIRYDANPVRRDGRIGSADFNFSFDLGPTRHQLLSYVTYGSQDRLSNKSTYDIRDVDTLASMGVPIIDGKPVVVYWPAPEVTPTVEEVIELADRRNVANDIRLDSDELSYGFIERLSFWDDRIFLVGGFRHDSLDSTTASIINNTPVSPIEDRDRVDTYSFSALAKVYESAKGEASVFYNNNETFIPVTTIDRRLATYGQKYPNRIASNDEFGFKLDLFESRVVATVSIFKTTETNVLVTEHDDTGEITGIIGTYFKTPVGTRTTKGWEADINIAATDSLEFIVAYADVDPRLETGNYAQKIAFDTFTLAGRYEI